MLEPAPGPPAAGFGLVGPAGPVVVGSRVLVRAAELLPAVATGGVVLYADLHEVVMAAVESLGLCRYDRYDRLALADQVRDQLAAYLVAVGAASPGARTSRALHGWVIGQDLPGVRAALLGAAAGIRPELSGRRLTFTWADTYALAAGQSADVTVEAVHPCQDDPGWVQVAGWWAGPDGDARLVVEVRAAALPAPAATGRAGGEAR